VVFVWYGDGMRVWESWISCVVVLTGPCDRLQPHVDTTPSEFLCSRLGLDASEYKRAQEHRRSQSSELNSRSSRRSTGSKPASLREKFGSLTITRPKLLETAGPGSLLSNSLTESLSAARKAVKFDQEIPVHDGENIWKKKKVVLGFWSNTLWWRCCDVDVTS
jgi:hypothetical protein